VPERVPTPASPRARTTVDHGAEDARTRRRGALGAIGLTVLIAVSLLVIGLREDAAPDVESAGPAPPFGPTPGAAGTPEEGVATAPDDVAPDEREPTPAEAAAFAAAHRPERGTDVQAVTVDLDGDGRLEVVVVAVVGGSTQVDVAAWDGAGYRVVYSGRGGPAERIAGFEAADLTGDGRREIVVAQSAPERDSVALWGLGADGIEPQVAHGGCWEGSHVYGTAGASIEDGELVATCDPARAPGEVHRYGWDGLRWSHEATEGT
jgi:hypothetical protein